VLFLEQVLAVLFYLGHGEAFVVDVDLRGLGEDVELYLGGNQVFSAAFAAVKIIEADISTFGASHCGTYLLRVMFSVSVQ
jgi:hypothetical protein